MSKKVNVHIGSIEDMGERFVDAWHRLERGEDIDKCHVTFPDLRALLSALSPKRLELLREVRREPAPSIKALADRLGRDYKRVHQDVETLLHVGLLDRGEEGIFSPYDVIHADFDLRDVA